MSRVVVQVVELNRRRHVELESITAAIAEAIHAGELDSVDNVRALEPVRELVRALRGLIAQPLPEVLLARSGTGELPVELEAPAHELDAIADELDAIADSTGGDDCASELESLSGRLRHRALGRS